MEVCQGNMLKVCHFTSVHDAKDRRIFSKECCSLAKLGFKVFIVAPNAVSEVIHDVQIIGVPVANDNRLYRIFFYTKLIFQKALELNADIYHFHDPELLSVGLKLKKKGKKVIFDSHEDVPQQILNKTYIPKPFRFLISRIYAKYESRIVAKLDATISVNDSIAEKLKKSNIHSVVIANYPEIIPSGNSGIRKENYICFAGAITENYLHHRVIEVINGIEDIRYSLAGPCHNKYLEKLKQHPGWKKVDYYGVLPYIEVLHLYQKAKIGIAIHDYTPNVGGKEGSLGILKNFEFMAAGLPIICTDFRVWKKIIEEEECGICVAPYDSEGLASAIRYLLDNPEIATRMGENGRKAVLEKYCWSSEEKKLVTLYNSL
ncbi:glycosyltransferase [Odoribacter splanchnicus]|uniref:Glycosyltransferase n=1 Tax=Odoribacter splanchnicus TaxID=28118 RepID=A0AAW5CA46_9BACT|nr:glycosyltransferase [Odoribacter splanchnicus]MBV4402238.1 glycosyltransferase [Odoribacter splanchnicus]MBV4410832.1 glycosyltransferase [Odoribacter splanchnicus]MCG4961897.1 glycosyltransferase [Odoribacter splanchnicus]MCG5004957.1 glycosyltransferase [Odoribacter splanchnicus]